MRSYDAYMPRELVEIWRAWDPDQALPEELIEFYRGLFGAEMADWPAEIREPRCRPGNLAQAMVQPGETTP